MSTEEKNNIINQIKEKRNIFIDYNNAKINSLHKSFNSEELINFFNYIPFLFTVNDPDFPGYISEMEAAPGIANYKVPIELLSKLKASNTSMDLQKQNAHEPFIILFALIGSGGTIAFTQDSDLDFWICGRFSKIDKESMLLLRRKCYMIERWAAEFYKKEIHFFVNDIDNIKMNIFDKDEEYGLSGASLGQTLKEEFYRSSIILNDAIPFWWVVPPCSDEQYAQYLRAIKDTPLEKEFIDLGNMAGVKKGDFLIAALFQIIKSLGNPFKSIIKLGLLEQYIYDDKKNPFISNIIKKNINEGKHEKTDVDAYCLMFDQIYDYYTEHIKDITAINIIRTCFYLKINPRLSLTEKTSENDNVKKIMSQYVKKWGWNNDIVKRIDDFKNWDIESTEKIMNNTKKIILKGYKNILGGLGSEMNAGSIDKDTLLAINRKIYSHFSPEDKKIDNTLNFKKYPPEKLLTLDYIVDAKGVGQWFLNKRAIINERAGKILIKKSPHLLSLVVWISLNSLYMKDFTRLDIAHGVYNLDPNYVRDLIAMLTIYFSIKSLHLHNSFFLRETFPVMSYIIINPFQKYSKKPDEIFFLYHSSWGETRFESYNNEKVIPELICKAINGTLLAGDDNRNTLYITSSEPFASTKDFATLKSTIKKLFYFFAENRTSVKQRFLTMIGDKFTIFSSSINNNGDTIVSFSQFNSEIQMAYTISYNRGIENQTQVDDEIPQLDYLAKIFSYYSDDSIKIFIHKGPKYSNFYVLNERGSLIMFRKRNEFYNEYLAGLILFAKNTAKKIMTANPNTKLTQSAQSNPNEDIIKTYLIDIDAAGKTNIQDFNYSKNAVIAQAMINKKFTVTLTLYLLENGEIGYRFTLPDGSNSEIYNRADIEDISREISSLMNSFDGYTFHPTAINLDNLDIKMYSQYTSLAFSEKNRFELLIEKNLGFI